MARIPVALYLRIRTADGSWSFAKASYTSKGMLRPLHAVVDGEHEHHPEGIYHLRFRVAGRLTWQAVGRDASLAQVEVQRKTVELQAVAVGITVQRNGPVSFPSVVASPDAGSKPVLAKGC